MTERTLTVAEAITQIEALECMPALDSIRIAERGQLVIQSEENADWISKTNVLAILACVHPDRRIQILEDELEVMRSMVGSYIRAGRYDDALGVLEA